MSLTELNNISHFFERPDGQPLRVIENVDFKMQEGEIVALLGKSGSGKSTLLRILAGLHQPSQGSVTYQGKQIYGPMLGIAMVFQNFALMPWLTVLENVELGLEALKIPAPIRRERALKAIDMIGMDGFENAYPKELSGGMRQRVGFARALVTEPQLLLMDEPFSALDVLTAESLRNDLMELWLAHDTKMKGILFVTHNIEEAILMADRVLVFGSNPGSIKGELKITLPQPRNSQAPEVLALIDEVYRMMTSQTTSTAKAPVRIHAKGSIEYRLPDVGIAELIGLLEALQELQQKGSIDLPLLADYIRLNIDDLFPVLEALSVLQLANVSEGDIAMTPKGQEFLKADITDKKVLFAKLLLEHVRLAQHIRNALEAAHGEKIAEDRFERELEAYFTADEAKRVLATMIDWGRYAELFAYDYNSGLLSLEDVN